MKRDSTTKLLAAGGALGPAVFVAGWSILGARRAGYGPGEAISELARLRTSTHAAMTASFLGFSAGTIAFGLSLRRTFHNKAWTAAVITAVSTAGVAAVPLSDAKEPWHFVFAAGAYASLAALPVLAADQLPPKYSTASRVVGVATGLMLLASFLAPEGRGYWQRAGLTLGDLWMAAVAVSIMRNRLIASARTTQ